ncbi:hypothetical protein ACGFI3_06815 [Nonomuraea wenchangensis]|uniref:hypothetical protein n=1 Tax=Nonomuraea wenchangensis TaxID=568860 RepID=UPI00371B0547
MIAEPMLLPTVLASPNTTPRPAASSEIFAMMRMCVLRFLILCAELFTAGLMSCFHIALLPFGGCCLQDGNQAWRCASGNVLTMERNTLRSASRWDRTSRVNTSGDMYSERRVRDSAVSESVLDDLSQRLSLLFNELGVSQRQFSAAVYRDHSGISRYLRGERLAPWNFVETLINEVSKKRRMNATELEEVARLHRRALEERNGLSALCQLLEQDLRAAREELRRAKGSRSGIAIRGEEERWPALAESLAAQGWPASTLAKLEAVTARAVGCLGNPATAMAYRSSGVIVAGLQSGKTTIAAGVIARALDAGYRLAIVLSTPLDLVRTQTQLRLDDALLGRAADEGRESGRFPLVRVTDGESDYRQSSTCNPWAFEKQDRRLPFYEPSNLYPALPRLLVVKQDVAVLQRLVRDLRALRPHLEEVPSLIVDLDPSSREWENEPIRQDNLTSIEIIEDLKSEIVGHLPRVRFLRFEHRAVCDSSNAMEGMPRSLWSDPPDFIISANLRNL